MIRFLTAAFLATSAVAFAQTNPCAAPLTGTSVPVVITYAQPAQIAATPIPSVPLVASGTAQLVSAASSNFAATVFGPVTLPTSAAIQAIPAVLTASPSIQSAQIASPNTLGTVLSQLSSGVAASVIYADTSVGTATALSNGISIVASRPGSSSSPAKLQSPAGTPVITGFSASSNQGACSLYQIAGTGFGSTTPPTVTLAAFNVFCDSQSSVTVTASGTSGVGIEGDGDVTACPSASDNTQSETTVSWYWYETEVPATVINATDSLITIGVPQSLAGIPSLAIVVTNNSDNLTNSFCSIQSGNDPCLASPAVYDPTTNGTTFTPLSYTN